MKKSILYRFLVITAAVLLVLTGCSTSQGSAADEVFNLRVLHINDSHSHVDPTTQDVEVPGYGTVRMELGGMTRISSLIGQYRGERENVLTLHAGDAIMGTTYFTFFNGDTEADVLNAMDFDAMAIGNHEFDLGDGFLADFISKLDFPVLSANIGTAPGNVLENSFEPYIIKEIGGQDVGIIGLTIAEKTRYSSSPSDEISFYDEGSSVQKSVDELKKMGIGKIIVLCHDTYDKSMGWASEVSDIDVIVSGDSHTLLGSELEAYGFAPEGDYPTMLTNRDGDPVYLVQAWEYAKALGVLDVTFTGDVVTA
ncbi:MAG: metallophosphoesterase, partial [Spirochaetales bacterium]|nr:metallophosphoesterase [Spirochaetales bacterium]